MGGTVLGLGELYIKLPALCYYVSWKRNYYASEEAVLGSHYAQLCNGILLLTQGLDQTTCKLADYLVMVAAINPSTSENLPPCIMQFLDTIIIVKDSVFILRDRVVGVAINVLITTWNPLTLPLYCYLPV